MLNIKGTSESPERRFEVYLEKSGNQILVKLAIKGSLPASACFGWSDSHPYTNHILKLTEECGKIRVTKSEGVNNDLFVTDGCGHILL